MENLHFVEFLVRVGSNSIRMKVDWDGEYGSLFNDDEARGTIGIPIWWREGLTRLLSEEEFSEMDITCTFNYLDIAWRATLDFLRDYISTWKLNPMCQCNNLVTQEDPNKLPDKGSGERICDGMRTGGPLLGNPTFRPRGRWKPHISDYNFVEQKGIVGRSDGDTNWREKR